jgi:hypothetical protein
MKNYENGVAPFDAFSLDRDSPLMLAQSHLLLIEDARRALEEIAAGQGIDAEVAMARLRAARARSRTQGPSR